MKRLLALLAAVALVGVAVLIRGAIDGSGDGGTPGADGNGDGPLDLTCGPELLAVCNSLADANSRIKVKVEPEADTAAKLADGTLTPDDSWAWLAAGDWPAYEAASGEEMPELASSEVLARSPAVIVARTDRMGVLEAHCGAVDWACIGDSAGSAWSTVGGDPGWGPIKVGIPEPDDGQGMVALNQAVASRIGSSDFATNDLDDPAVSAWFQRLEDLSGGGTSSTNPLVEFIRLPNSLSVVGAIESVAIQELSSYAGADSLTVIAPEPVATADVQLWAADDESLSKSMSVLVDAGLTDALAAAGWRVPETPGTGSQGTGSQGGGGLGAGATYRVRAASDSIGSDMVSFDTPLPDGSGLPRPGVVWTVNSRWEET
ncbi:MAG: hypothetical protein ACK5O2_13210 [Microthrixaceae bacterium]